MLKVFRCATRHGDICKVSVWQFPRSQQMSASSGEGNTGDQKAVEEKSKSQTNTTAIPQNIQSHQGADHAFGRYRDRDIVDHGLGGLHAPIGLGSSTSSQSAMSGIGANGSGANDVQQNVANAYDRSSQISLHGVMQSNVPHPFQSSEIKGNPSHLNMPAGGVKLGDKFLAGSVHEAHPSMAIDRNGKNINTSNKKSYSTLSSSAAPVFLYSGARFRHSNVQGAQEVPESQSSSSSPELPSVQGIQGSDCEKFEIWKENCVKYGLPNCDEQLQGVQSGRKTLSQIFEEQDVLIAQIAKDYAAEGKASVNSQPGDGQDLSARQKLQRAVKEYGATVIVFHVGISLMSLGGFYLAVSSGIDMVSLLGKLGLAGSVAESKLATGTSTFVVAYAVHKVFAPVRIGITLTSTPLIVRYLRKIGFLKVPKKV